MRIDLPLCNLKNCRYCFDGNCTDTIKYEQCEYTVAKEEKARGEWIKHIDDLFPKESTEEGEK